MQPCCPSNLSALTSKGTAQRTTDLKSHSHSHLINAQFWGGHMVAEFSIHLGLCQKVVLDKFSLSEVVTNKLKHNGERK